MSLFQCEHCGCCENTAYSLQGFKLFADSFDWSYAPEREGMLLCSACGPTKHSDGSRTGFGVWHNQTPRIFLPKGMFRKARNGNLEHIETGDQHIMKYRIFPDSDSIPIIRASKSSMTLDTVDACVRLDGCVQAESNPAQESVVDIAQFNRTRYELRLQTTAQMLAHMQAMFNWKHYSGLAHMREMFESGVHRILHDARQMTYDLDYCFDVVVSRLDTELFGLVLQQLTPRTTDLELFHAVFCLLNASHLRLEDSVNNKHCLYTDLIHIKASSAQEKGKQDVVLTYSGIIVQ